jgi:arylsulfatase A-like enzyme
VSAAAALRWLAGYAAAAAIGCGPGAPPPPNLVLITLESLRTDHVGAYGGRSPTRPEQPITPNLDAFAAGALRFDDAHAVSSWTLTSHASLFTGLYPSAHRAVRPLDRLSDSYPTLAEALAAAGYQTAGVVSGPYLRRAHNLSQGFELWDDGISSLTDAVAHDDVTNPGMEKALARFLETERDQGRPFFLFAYFWDPHYDYLPPPPHDSEFVPPGAERMDLTRFETNPSIYRGMPPARLAWILSQYAGEIRATDECLGRIFRLLQQEGLWDDTAILVTADHGEEFFDHGEKGHKNNLFAETIHIPLLLKLPAPAGGGVDRRLASQVDVLPTLLSLAGVTPDFPVQGRSLLEPAPPGGRAIFFDLITTWVYRRLDGSTFEENQRWHGARDANWKLVWREGDGQAAPLRRLYHAASDPADRDDVSAARDAEVRSLESLFQAQQKESEEIAAPHPPGGAAKLTERELESLRALGYLVDP